MELLQWVLAGAIYVLGHAMTARAIARWLIKNNYASTREGAARLASTLALGWFLYVPAVLGVRASRWVSRMTASGLPMPLREVHRLEREMGLGGHLEAAQVYDPATVPGQPQYRRAEALDWCSGCLGSVIPISSSPVRYIHAPTLGEGAPCGTLVPDVLVLSKEQRDRVLHGRIMKAAEDRLAILAEQAKTPEERYADAAEAARRQIGHMALLPPLDLGQHQEDTDQRLHRLLHGDGPWRECQRCVSVSIPPSWF